MQKLIKFLVIAVVATGVVGVALTGYARASGSAEWLAVSSSFNVVGVPLVIIGLLAVAVVGFVRNRRAAR